MYILHKDHSYADLKKKSSTIILLEFISKNVRIAIWKQKICLFSYFPKEPYIGRLPKWPILRPGHPLCVTASQKGQSNSGFAFTYAIMNKIGKIMAQFCTIYIDLLELQFTKININTISKSISPNCFSCCTKQNELIISIFLARITNKY